MHLVVDATGIVAHARELDVNALETEAAAARARHLAGRHIALPAVVLHVGVVAQSHVGRARPRCLRRQSGRRSLSAERRLLLGHSLSRNRARRLVLHRVGLLSRGGVRLLDLLLLGVFGGRGLLDLLLLGRLVDLLLLSGWYGRGVGHRLLDLGCSRLFRCGIRRLVDDLGKRNARQERQHESEQQGCCESGDLHLLRLLNVHVRFTSFEKEFNRADGTTILDSRTPATWPFVSQRAKEGQLAARKPPHDVHRLPRPTAPCRFSGLWILGHRLTAAHDRASAVSSQTTSSSSSCSCRESISACISPSATKSVGSAS